MAAIKGYLSMIMEGVAGKIDKRALEHVDKAFANVKRLDILVNELLDVSRLEQGRIQFDMQSVDIADVIKQVAEELKVKADEKKLFIKYQELPKPHPKIFADPDRIAQILDNILGNAIKYTFKGGVSIYHEVDKDGLKTMIKDTGIGMSATDRKRLFEKFYRIQNEKTLDIPGTGLGLWITRELVKRQNGEIFADSMENVGSQFTIVFPIIKDKQ
jgi:signal transduction histidine kinase